ncbi:7 transmembrane receptor (rhodopsin family) domain-containing protein [Ditylenchus destructor]|nr:7 transmembrane receptor (rhodopsin family) domain-containing protein [Ditylenchus destructor]
MSIAKFFPIAGLTNMSRGGDSVIAAMNRAEAATAQSPFSDHSTNHTPMNRNAGYFSEYNDALGPLGTESLQLEETSLVAILYLSYMPICCLFGLTGNCMVWILIRSNRIFKKLPSSAYLLALALMSSLFLMSLLSFWVEEGFMKDQSEKHSMILCKSATFLAHFCDFASVWLIVCVGFERLTLLYRVSFRRSLVNAKRHVIFLLIASGLCNMWILFVAEINVYGGCDIKPQYEEVYNTFSLIETIICMIIPTGFIILSNFFVILKLRAHMKQIPSSPTVSFNTADTVYSTGPLHTTKTTKISKASLCRMGSKLSVSHAGLPTNPEAMASRIKRHSLRYTDLQLTRSLLIVTTVFIALNLPNYLYRIGIQFFHINDQSDLMQRLSFIAHILLYSHHACLFYLYIFNSPQMRKRLIPTALKLLECYCFKPHMQDFSDHGAI